MTKQIDRTSAPANDLPKLAAPARRALAAAGITYLEQLTRVSEAELAQLHGMGPNAIRTLQIAMTERGLKFAQGNASKGVAGRANRNIKRRKPTGKK